MNFELIDYDAKANFVIERVFEWGDVKDIRQCLIYPDKFYKSVILPDSNFSAVA